MAQPDTYNRLGDEGSEHWMKWQPYPAVLQNRQYDGPAKEPQAMKYLEDPWAGQSQAQCLLAILADQVVVALATDDRRNVQWDCMPAISRMVLGYELPAVLFRDRRRDMTSFAAWVQREKQQRRRQQQPAAAPAPPPIFVATAAQLASILRGLLEGAGLAVAIPDAVLNAGGFTQETARFLEGCRMTCTAVNQPLPAADPKVVGYLDFVQGADVKCIQALGVGCWIRWDRDRASPEAFDPNPAPLFRTTGLPPVAARCGRPGCSLIVVQFDVDARLTVDPSGFGRRSLFQDEDGRLAVHVTQPAAPGDIQNGPWVHRMVDLREHVAPLATVIRGDRPLSHMVCIAINGVLWSRGWQTIDTLAPHEDALKTWTKRLGLKLHPMTQAVVEPQAAGNPSCACGPLATMERPMETVGYMFVPKDPANHPPLCVVPAHPPHPTQATWAIVDDRGWQRAFLTQGFQEQVDFADYTLHKVFARHPLSSGIAYTHLGVLHPPCRTPPPLVQPTYNGTQWKNALEQRWEMSQWRSNRQAVDRTIYQLPLTAVHGPRFVGYSMVTREERWCLLFHEPWVVTSAGFRTNHDWDVFPRSAKTAALVHAERLMQNGTCSANQRRCFELHRRDHHSPLPATAPVVPIPPSLKGLVVAPSRGSDDLLRALEAEFSLREVAHVAPTNPDLYGFVCVCGGGRVVLVRSFDWMRWGDTAASGGAEFTWTTGQGQGQGQGQPEAALWQYRRLYVLREFALPRAPSILGLETAVNAVRMHLRLTDPHRFVPHAAVDGSGDPAAFVQAALHPYQVVPVPNARGDGLKPIQQTVAYVVAWAGAAGCEWSALVRYDGEAAWMLLPLGWGDDEECLRYVLHATTVHSIVYRVVATDGARMPKRAVKPKPKGPERPQPQPKPRPPPVAAPPQNALDHAIVQAMAAIWPCLGTCSVKTEA